MDETLRSAGVPVRPLRLEPFHALRYAPDAVADPGVVTCPPYDVIGADRISRWEAADPYNIVRLILPTGQDRYAHAARELEAWLDAGVLRVDDRPGLYVYEQTAPDERTIGLVGAVSLHDAAERRILPHEDVFPGPVRDRAALMDALRAQLEPILLSYDGDGAASDLVDALAATVPLLETETADGHVHRIWVTTDPADHATVAADLADRQALIADGHHRYAAYRALAEADRGVTTGLAMLVDAQRHPLTLGPIHRSVAGLALADAARAAARGFRRVTAVSPASTEHLVGLTGHDPMRFVITDGRDAVVLADPDPDTTALPASRSSRWRGLAASVATAVILGALWGRDDADASVVYHHRAEDAVARAQRDDGVALLLAPASHADVMAVARDGDRMPRKSTSFGPKPRTGLLMRLLDDN